MHEAILSIPTNLGIIMITKHDSEKDHNDSTTHNPTSVSSEAFTVETLHSSQHELTVRKYCDPLFLNDPFLMEGHSNATPNATLTFLQHHGVVYGVTCAHVIKETVVSRPEEDALALQLMIGRCVLNLGNFDADGFQLGFKELSDGATPALDLAVIPLPPDTWALLQEHKDKKAIDLGQITVPDLKTLQMGLAFGYPNEHKRHASGPDGTTQVATGLAMVVATLNLIYKDDRFVTLSDELTEAHRYFFSGMSGGPIFGEDKEGNIHFLGIITEGAPGSAKTWNERNSDAFLTDTSVLVRGVRVTKDRWVSWQDG